LDNNYHQGKYHNQFVQQLPWYCEKYLQDTKEGLWFQASRIVQLDKAIVDMLSPLWHCRNIPLGNSSNRLTMIFLTKGCKFHADNRILKFLGDNTAL
jgi:hypothetical protein